MAAMKRWRDLGLFALLLLAVGVLLPQSADGPDLDRTATALTLAGPAVGAALSFAVGRPNLAVGALAGVGAYVSGALALRGLNVALAVPVAIVVSAVAGAAVAVATARLDVVGLLASTLLIAVGLGALTQALPDLSGGQAGLGPLPPLGTALPGSGVLDLTPTGDLHATLAFAALMTVVAAVVLQSPIGARWRAVGSDRGRAAMSGLRPLRAEVLALAAGGGLAGFGGALSAHIGGAATPDLFSPDVVALPLLAAVLAGRGNALAAVVTAVATGLVGAVVLPDLGWHGPPSATAVALGMLALGVVVSLLPGAASRGRYGATDIDVGAPWPFSAGEFAGAELVVEHLDVRTGGLTLVHDLSLRALAGQVLGVVGPNGSGKTSLLAILSAGASSSVRLEGGSGPIVLQPQAGGGFAACTVDETLALAARGGGRSRPEAERVAALWRARLGLDQSGATLCAELSSGRRRLLDLARVLLRRPTVLLCDEPLGGLDPTARAAAVGLLRAAASAGLTIVLAEHDRPAVAELATATLELRRDEEPVLLTEPST
jgi:ABC-type branched-subunit amino acid transport system permease subunit/ABC-type branched-subunit amino acid transport system ATPase component